MGMVYFTAVLYNSLSKALRVGTQAGQTPGGRI